MNNGKDTFATNPGAIFVLDAAVVQNRRLVEGDAPTMNLFGEWQFIGMEVLPT